MVRRTSRMQPRIIAPGDACRSLHASLACLRYPRRLRDYLYHTMTVEQFLLIALKSTAVGLLLGAVAYRLKGRSFLAWAIIGAAAAAVFPGLSLLALMALALLPRKS